MRKFADAGMWNSRNDLSVKGLALAPTEIPATAITLTEEAGVRHSELSPVYTANQGGLIMTSARDYGTLYAAGRPL